MPDRRAAAEVRAAGAVLWRRAGGGTQVALIHRPKYDDWSFPKGKAEAGEHLLLTAVREVREETRLDVTLGRRLDPVHYLVSAGLKRVDYWVAWPEGGSDGRPSSGPAAASAAGGSAAGGSAAGESPWGSGGSGGSAESGGSEGSAGSGGSAGGPDFEPTSEVDEVRWLPASRAGEQLSYPHDAQMLAGFRAGPRHTVPLILLRHSSAGSKAAWTKDDLSRPLDSGGAKEASELARLLRCFGVARVVSSPAERCLATVRPYAAATGGEVEVEPSFVVVKGGGASGRANGNGGPSGKGSGKAKDHGGARDHGGGKGRGAAKGGAEAEGGTTAKGLGGAKGGGSKQSDGGAGVGGRLEGAEIAVGGADGRRVAGTDAADGVNVVSVEAAKAAALLAASDEPVIICAHRENLPLLIEAACAELGAEAPAGEPLRKGEFLVLHRADGRVAAVERYHLDDAI